MVKMASENVYVCIDQCRDTTVHDAELFEVDSELASIEAEIDSLLCRQSELQERKSLLLARLESVTVTEQPIAQPQELDWENEVFPWNDEVRTVMKSTFKLDSFRPLQLSSINATLSNRDNILIMPTGGGKSLCYQLPSLIKNGLTLVISPLVSLMHDQLLAVQALQIESKMINAATPKDEVTRVHRNMSAKGSTLKLLYVTPERIAKSKRFMSSLEKSHKLKQLALIVIDEVHCASQWGHDFRPDYKKLRILKTQFPDCAILGLTATATSKVLTDVKEMLSLSRCLVFRASYNRPNLFYEVREKRNSRMILAEEMAKLIKTKYRNDSGLVYCFSRKDCEDVTSDLLGLGVKAGCYHADFTSEQRTRVHNNWLNGSIKVIVATIAFGMGIDKPNVRFVLHHTLSKSMENYYQESGRGGRDGQRTDCVLFFKAADVFRQSTMVFTEHTGLANLYTMVRYCLNSTECRRSLIARSFGEKWCESDCPTACDVCVWKSQQGFSSSGGAASTQQDITEHCQTLIELIKQAQTRDKRLTAQMLIESWRGNGQYKLSHVSATNMLPAQCELVLLHVMLEDVLKADFHFTPFSTICYIGLGRKAGLVKKGVTRIKQTVRPSSLKEVSSQRKVHKPDDQTDVVLSKPSVAVQSKKRKLPVFDSSTVSEEEGVQIHSKKHCGSSAVIEIDSD